MKKTWLLFLILFIVIFFLCFGLRIFKALADTYGSWQTTSSDSYGAWGSAACGGLAPPNPDWSKDSCNGDTYNSYSCGSTDDKSCTDMQYLGNLVGCKNRSVICYAPPADTCNGDNVNSYTCAPSDSKTCTDTAGVDYRTITCTATCTGSVSISWTDPTIAANSTKIRKVHMDELRSWINNRRADAGLSSYSWTDAAITANSTKIRKVHFDEARQAIAEVYTACGQSAPSWTDSTLTSDSTKIRKVHMDELRSAVSSAP